MTKGEREGLYKTSGKEPDKCMVYFDRVYSKPKCCICHAELRVTEIDTDGTCMTSGCNRNKLFVEINKIMNPV